MRRVWLSCAGGGGAEVRLCRTHAARRGVDAAARAKRFLRLAAHRHLDGRLLFLCVYVYVCVLLLFT